MRSAVTLLRRDITQWTFRLKHHKHSHSFTEFTAIADELKQQFLDEYLEYTSQVSSPSMAISLELSAFLYYICGLIKPNVILDMGSGFSSYVFRKYQAEEPSHPIVYSVDDDEPWLNRTAEFLIRHRLSVEHLYKVEQFNSLDQKITADLILHDMSNPDIRAKTLPQLIKYCSSTSLIVLDDIQKGIIRPAAVKFIRDRRLNYFDLRPVLVDEFGRYQWCLFGFA